MSRHYSIQFRVAGFNSDRVEQIKNAAAGEWPVELEELLVEDEGNVLIGDAEDSLGGGESEEEFSLRITKAIFRANGGPCMVTVNATYLEDRPYESYEYGPEDDYVVMNRVLRYEPEEPEDEDGEPTA